MAFNDYTCIISATEYSKSIRLLLQWFKALYYGHLHYFSGHVTYFTLSFLSLYTARPSFEYYRQVYFVHSRLQDESLQVTISKLP